jgi:rSAM/selenodomain-associated transferase 2/rSAM/selenodomain-associated transferase 1
MPCHRCEQLIVFTRYPRPGRTKTRLIPYLGRRKAAELQKRMAEQLMGRIYKLAWQKPLAVEIRFVGGSRRAMRRWLGANWEYRPQPRGSLGRRMYTCLAEAFNAGADAAVLIGSDIPGISAQTLVAAFETLQGRDVVLGPAQDGGYYLIGMNAHTLRKSGRRLFSGIRWGSTEVSGQTLAAARHLGLSVGRLDPLCDVDRPGDLGWALPQIYQPPEARRLQQVSVIIPTLNEADTIAATLANLDRRKVCEIIVVDGGSSDSTVEQMRGADVQVLAGPPCRAVQLNRGAALARGDVLLFLHADTRLPRRFAPTVLQALQRPGTVATAFELRIDGRAPGLRLVERLANWRSRRLQLPYGDQALAMPAQRFYEVGGFPVIAVMEDYGLVRQLGRRGRIAILPMAVITSARRWSRLGIVQTTLLNQIMLLGYTCGIRPGRLARWYRRGRGLDNGRPPRAIPIRRLRHGLLI